MLGPFYIFRLSIDTSTVSWKTGWNPEPVCCYSMASMAVFEGSGLFLQESRQVIKWGSKKMKSAPSSEKIALDCREVKLWSELWLIWYKYARYWLQYICYGLCTYDCVRDGCCVLLSISTLGSVLWVTARQTQHLECREIIANNMEKCDEKRKQLCFYCQSQWLYGLRCGTAATR